MSLSTIGSGDPDLFINIGDERLPSKDSADISSSTLKSEIVTINLKHPFFVTHGRKSMRGPFLIGVYGRKKSNFTLSLTQEKYPVSILSDNTALRTVQDEFEIVYFAWYNLEMEEAKYKDLRISLNLFSGVADLYVATFKDEQGSKTFVEKLPKSKKDAQWV